MTLTEEKVHVCKSKSCGLDENRRREEGGAEGGGGREGKCQSGHGGRLDEVGHVQRLEEGISLFRTKRLDAVGGRGRWLRW